MSRWKPSASPRAACLLLGLLSACERASQPLAPQARTHAAPAPADLGELCLDVAAHRACWGGACGEQGCLVARPLPGPLVPAAGFRCSGQGEARRCVARSDDASRFQCTGDRCVQHVPRVPDNGEWVCVDLGGAVYCRRAVEAAGIPSGVLDPAWTCGARRGSGERICVDFAPDLPSLDRRWSCSVSYAAGVAERVCQPAQQARLDDVCPAEGGCPPGATCVAGRCLPARPRPDCWLDTDCPTGACRFGSCAGEP